MNQLHEQLLPVLDAERRRALQRPYRAERPPGPRHLPVVPRRPSRMVLLAHRARAALARRLAV